VAGDLAGDPLGALGIDVTDPDLCPLGGEPSGGRVVLAQEVDPSLLGGLVVRVGDRLIDGSVLGRLERLRNQLVSGAL